jgi:RNA recognition motif-containing protein
VLLQYGQNGRSLGSATIIFAKHEQALKATATLNGVKIDNRPVRVEMLVSAANLPAAAPQASLADRVTYVIHSLMSSLHTNIAQSRQEGQTQACHRSQGSPGHCRTWSRTWRPC